VSDPAGWYPDPTTRHELRYWDGYAWLDNVSDSGTAAADPLGGKPMPPPSEAAAKAQQGPPPAAAKSKLPLYIGGAAVAVVVIAAAVLLLTGGDDKKKVTALADKQVTFNDDVKDIGNPIVHTVHAKANTAVLITVTSDNQDVRPGIVVLAQQKTVEDVAVKIEGSRDVLSGSLKDACSNLREEDIGATDAGVVFLARASHSAGTQLDSFMVVPIEGDFEFVPVLVNSKRQCEAGKSTLVLNPKFLDFSNVRNVDDFASVIANDSVLSDIDKVELADKQATFDDEVTDLGRPIIHTVHIKANTVVLITVKSDSTDNKPGVVVLAEQRTVDDLTDKIEGLGDLLSSSLRDACSNLSEEGIGAKGTFVYLAQASDSAGTQLEAFTVVPIEGDFEFVPVLVNADGECETGRSTLDIVPKFLDFGDVNNIDDLVSVIENDPDLSRFVN
jgi:hypothetical protein